MRIPLLDRLFSRKVSSVQPLIFAQYGHQTRGVSHPRNPAQYADEAFRKNAIAHACVSKVSRAAAGIPIKVKIGDRDADASHPLVRLLNRPNPWQSRQSLFEATVAHILLSGNTYIEGVGPDNAAPRELWSLRPDRTRVVPGALGVAGYTYEVNGQLKRWECDPITGQSPVLHMKTFNPLNDWYGMSPIEAAALAVDAHNEAGQWNQALLQNSARPSGAVVYNNTAGGTLTDKQYERLKEEVNSTIAGARNAGRPMILEGGLSWQAMGFSPADMDWLEGKHVSAREIALVFGVAPMLLGIPGDNTFSNYQEARQSLYEDTVLPLFTCVLDSLTVWLSPAFGENITIVADVENLPAFAEKRKVRWDSVQNATWLTTNEKRLATGYEPDKSAEADEILIPSGMVPLTLSSEPVDGDETMPKPEGDEKPEGDDAEEMDDEKEDDAEEGDDLNEDGTEKEEDADAPTATDGAPVTGAEQVQATALNGAQIASLMDVVNQVVDGTITPEIARTILAVAFPAVLASTLDALIAAVSAAPKKPKAPAPTFTPGVNPNAPTPPQDNDEKPKPPKKPVP